MASNPQAAKQPVFISTDFAALIRIQNLCSMELSSLPHIRYLKEVCVKALNLLRAVAHTCWGAEQQTFLHLYRSLVHSKLGYGSVVYGSAWESYLGGSVAQWWGQLSRQLSDALYNSWTLLFYVYWIRYRTIHCGYTSVPSEPHLPQVCVFKPMNLHSTYGEECWAYSIPSHLAHPWAIRLTIRSSAQYWKLHSLLNLIRSQRWASELHRNWKRLVLSGILYLGYLFQPLVDGC